MYKDNLEKWLEFCRFAAQLPDPARKTAEEHPGVICHKDLYGLHVWIQVYNDDGTVHLLHGADSTLPGLETRRSDANELTICDCDRWKPATKEQKLESVQKVTKLITVMKAVRESEKN